MSLIQEADKLKTVLRVLKMLIIHDIVEIDAGNCLVYDEAAPEAKGSLSYRPRNGYLALFGKGAREPG